MMSKSVSDENEKILNLLASRFPSIHEAKLAKEDLIEVVQGRKNEQEQILNRLFESLHKHQPSLFEAIENDSDAPAFQDDSNPKNKGLLLASTLINLVDPKTLQDLVEKDVEIRESFHKTYTKIEDALMPNCINQVGDLYNNKQVKASILMKAAKARRGAKQKFDPSPYLANYELYNKQKHGNPVAYLVTHFGEYFASCNDENTDYLYRGDIPLIDQNLRGALYRNHKDQFESLTNIAGKKSKTLSAQISSRGKNKLNKIISLYSNARRKNPKKQ